MGVMRGWHVYEVEIARRQVGEVSRQLTALGATGLQEDVLPGTLPVLRQPWDTGPVVRQPRRVLLRAWFTALPEAGLTGAAAATPVGRWSFQPEEDWNEGWKQHFQPIRISPRLLIAAPWHGPFPGDGEQLVIIEPGNAFGTGDHVTTRACLVAIDRFAVSGGTLLDVGCGSGILALAGARLGMRAFGNDLDPDAVRAADEAAALNGLPAVFSTAPLGALPQAFPRQFDLVVANLYAEVLALLAPHLLSMAAGPIACAGILSDRSHLVREALGSRALLVDETEGDWTHLVFAGPVDGEAGAGRGEA
ncbi:MAG: methyltransferase domain-containing protein [Myxococcales bacterium]|nr:methyltransferase domain-containing protein [Myxococcales bacterium]